MRQVSEPTWGFFPLFMYVVWWSEYDLYIYTGHPPLLLLVTWGGPKSLQYIYHFRMYIWILIFNLDHIYFLYGPVPIIQQV